MNAPIRLVLPALLMLAGTQVHATVVKGRVDYHDPVTIFPMVNASVEACPAQSPDACTRYVTGSDGLYYLDVPPGTYELKVNGTSRGVLTIPDQPVYDVEPQRGN